MSRLPITQGTAYKPMPDVYSALLLVGILFMLVGIIVVGHDLLSANGYGMSIGELFSSPKLPQ